MVALLLQAGADKDKANNGGATPLYVSSHEGHEKVVARLIDAGADIDAADKHGSTLLIIASQNGHDKVVARLIDAGADKEKRSHWDTSPMIVACCYGHLEAAKRLYDAGADVDVENEKGDSARKLALADPDSGIAQYFLEAEGRAQALEELLAMEDESKSNSESKKAANNLSLIHI